VNFYTMLRVLIVVVVITLVFGQITSTASAVRTITPKSIHHLGS
jgi:hypothetical protein